jgi:3-oxoacyl-[acyl-carrier protein] reductase
MSDSFPSTRLTAVVTGGSGGIGAAICRRLAADGYHVLVGYHSSSDKAEELAADLTGSGHGVARVSVTDPESLTVLADQVESSFGHLDLLVNCAGVTEPVAHDDLSGLTDELIDRIFMTNWRGPFATIRSLEPALSRAESPVVVNISSIAAVTGQGSNVAYCASKAALDSMTRSLGRALGPKIRVLSVSPGWVRGEYAERMPAGALAAQEQATPLRRLAFPQDVAAAVSVAARELTFTTGSVIPVDGGRQLGVV